MLLEVLQPQRLGVVDDVAEDAAAPRRLAERGGLRFGQAVGAEVGQPAGAVEDAERPVSGVDERAGGGDDPVEHDRQLQPRPDADDRVQQRAPPLPAHDDLVDARAQLGEQLVDRALVRARRVTPFGGHAPMLSARAPAVDARGPAAHSQPRRTGCVARAGSRSRER